MLDCPTTYAALISTANAGGNHIPSRSAPVAR
jgi:hypothetical protein